MHQIYSCSDENLEVFTVISSKSCSPIRRKTKGTQCILSKKVGAVSDYHPQGTHELSHQSDLMNVFYKNKDGPDFSPLQNRQKGFFPNLIKCPETHSRGTLWHPRDGRLYPTTYESKALPRRSSFAFLFLRHPPVSPKSHCWDQGTLRDKKLRIIGGEMSKQQSFSYSNNQSDVKSLQLQESPGCQHNTKWIAATEPAIKDSVAKEHAKLPWKNIEDDTTLIHATEASSPLTGSTLSGTPSLLRKIWMKHKKKAEYLGATNGAFEAD